MLKLKESCKEQPKGLSANATHTKSLFNDKKRQHLTACMPIGLLAFESAAAAVVVVEAEFFWLSDEATNSASHTSSLGSSQSQ